MNEWESNWAGYLAQETGSANVEFTTRVFQLWQRSTPTEPWTNNPLGMPYTAKGAHRALSTDYGAFMSMRDFRTSFLGFLTSVPARRLRDALLLQEKLPPIWRAISDLHWPASVTETDYPSAILDATTEDYRARVNAARAEQRKTAGSIGPGAADRPYPGTMAQRRDYLMGDFGALTRTLRQLGER